MHELEDIQESMTIESNGNTISGESPMRYKPNWHVCAGGGEGQTPAHGLFSCQTAVFAMASAGSFLRTFSLPLFFGRGSFPRADQKHTQHFLFEHCTLILLGTLSQPDPTRTC